MSDPGQDTGGAADFLKDASAPVAAPGTALADSPKSTGGAADFLAAAGEPKPVKSSYAPSNWRNQSSDTSSGYKTFDPIKGGLVSPQGGTGLVHAPGMKPPGGSAVAAFVSAFPGFGGGPAPHTQGSPPGAFGGGGPSAEMAASFAAQKAADFRHHPPGTREPGTGSGTFGGGGGTVDQRDVPKITTDQALATPGQGANPLEVLRQAVASMLSPVASVVGGLSPVGMIGNVMQKAGGSGPVGQVGKGLSNAAAGFANPASLAAPFTDPVGTASGIITGNWDAFSPSSKMSLSERTETWATDLALVLGAAHAIKGGVAGLRGSVPGPLVDAGHAFAAGDVEGGKAAMVANGIPEAQATKIAEASGFEDTGRLDARGKPIYRVKALGVETPAAGKGGGLSSAPKILRGTQDDMTSVGGLSSAPEILRPTQDDMSPAAYSSPYGENLARNYRAGNNNATVNFAHPLQRDFYDLGAKLRAQTRAGSNLAEMNAPTGTADKIAGLTDTLANHTGLNLGDVANLARDVHSDVKAQMVGIQDGETRTLVDNHLQQWAAPLKGSAPPPIAEASRRVAPTPLAAVKGAGEPVEGPRTGAYNQSAAEVVKAMGIEPKEAPPGPSVQAWTDAAREKGYPDNAAQIATRVVEEKGSLDHEQTVGLGMRLASLRGAYDIADAGAKPGIEAEAGLIQQAIKLAGASWARQGIARQAEFNNAMDYLGLKLRFEAESGGRKADPALDRQFQQLSARHADVVRQLEEMKGAQGASRVSGPSPGPPRPPRYGDIEAVRSERQALVDKLKVLTGKAATGIDPQYAPLLARLVGNYLKEGGIRVSDAVDKVRADFPEFSARDLRDNFSGYGKDAQPVSEAARAMTGHRREGRLTSAIEDLEQGIQPDKRAATSHPVPKEIVSLIQRKAQLEAMAKAAIEKNRPKGMAERVANYVREGCLSSPVVFGKLIAYDLAEGPLAMVRDVIDPIFGKLPAGDGKTLADVAGTRGTGGLSGAVVSVRARVSPATAADALSNAWAVLRTGTDKIGEMASDKAPKEMAGPFGRIHGAIKQVIATNEFHASFAKGIMEAGSKGLNVRDPDVIQAIGQESARDAMRAKLQGPNGLADVLNMLPRAKSSKLIYKAVGFAAETQLPFRRVPLNLAKAGFDYSGGGVARGAILQIAEKMTAARTGKPMEAARAKEIMDAYTRGGIGLAGMTLGYLNAGSVEGYDSKDWRKQGHITLLGHTVPLALSEHPFFWAVNFGATLRHMYDAAGPAGLGKAVLVTARNRAARLPGAVPVENLAAMFDPRENLSKRAGNLAAGMAIPALISQIAKGTDAKPGVSPLEPVFTSEGMENRQTKEFWDPFRGRLPWLRSGLPVASLHHPRAAAGLPKGIGLPSMTR